MGKKHASQYANFGWLPPITYNQKIKALPILIDKIPFKIINYYNFKYIKHI